MFVFDEKFKSEVLYRIALSRRRRAFANDTSFRDSCNLIGQNCLVVENSLFLNRRLAIAQYEEFKAAL